MVVVELKTERVISVKVNLVATAPPTLTDDTDAGYEVLSAWVDTVGGRIYLLADASAGAAIWNSVGNVSSIGASMTGVTASVTQTQAGATVLTGELVEVTTVATANDAVRIPAAILGVPCKVINQGANTLQVFPTSGDKIDGGATDASVTIAPGTSVQFHAIDAASWYS